MTDTYDDQLDELVAQGRITTEEFYVAHCPLCQKKVTMTEHEYTVFPCKQDAVDALAEHIDGHWDSDKKAFISDHDGFYCGCAGLD